MARKNGGGPTERAIEAILNTQSAQATSIEGIHTSIGAMRTDIDAMRTDIDGMRGDMREMRDGMLEMRDDIRTLTRVMVRRFGTSGSPDPTVGDHVLFRSRDGVWRPAIVLAVHPSNNALDLEVFGMRDGDDRRYPSAASSGEDPGCWRLPG